MPSDWSVDSLYQHFASLLSENEKQRNTAFANLQAQLDRRIEVANSERRDTEKHLCSLMDAGDEKLGAHIQAQREAIQEASRLLDKRLEALNALREEVTKDRLLFMTKDEIQANLASFKVAMDKAEENWNRRFDTLGERVTLLDTQMTERRGGEQSERRRQQQVQPWQIWVAGAILALIIVLVNTVVPTPTW